MSDLAQLEEQMQIVFEDRDLLQQAFIHRSYVNEVVEGDAPEDNERLEFLGDSVLGFITSDYLYRRFPDLNEGDLTRLRSSLVCRTTLARLARRLSLGALLWLGRGEAESGGEKRTATLCAVFEALVGALFLDQGLDVTVQFVLGQMEPELQRVQTFDIAKDAKSRLQEYIQSECGKTPRYRTLESRGPDHARHYIQKVSAARTIMGIGQGYSKQEAEQSAAAMALFRLGEPAPEYDPDDELEAQYDLPPIDKLNCE